MRTRLIKRKKMKVREKNGGGGGEKHQGTKDGKMSALYTCPGIVRLSVSRLTFYFPSLSLHLLRLFLIFKLLFCERRKLANSERESCWNFFLPVWARARVLSRALIYYYFGAPFFLSFLPSFFRVTFYYTSVEMTFYFDCQWKWNTSFLQIKANFSRVLYKFINYLFETLQARKSNFLNFFQKEVWKLKWTNENY